MQSPCELAHARRFACASHLIFSVTGIFDRGDGRLDASAILGDGNGKIGLFEFAVHDLVALRYDHRNLIFVGFEPFHVVVGHEDFRENGCALAAGDRSEEHTSELQSLMRNSYAVFCLKKKKTNNYIKIIKPIY